MKTLQYCSAIFLPLLMSCGTAAISPVLLEPSNVASSQRILPLKVGLATEIVRSESEKTISVQSELATIFERELEANIFSPQKERWGYAELKIVYDETGMTGAGGALLAFSIITLTIPNWVGFPFLIESTTLQAEISFYDSKKNLVKKFIYTKDESTTIGLYYGGSLASAPYACHDHKGHDERLKERFGNSRKTHQSFTD